MTEETQRAVGMLRTMAEMQDIHNVHVHPQWRVQGFEYYRAIWVECAELLDHFGWKWWKHQAPDIDQVKLELVDIWHFGLSDLLRTDTLGDDVIAPLLAQTRGSDAKQQDADADCLRLAVESLARATLVSRGFDITAFAEVMRALPMSFDELFDMYVGKNVLNNFRQDHGYKSGEYQKLWNGREDNEHLVEILAGIECHPDEMAETLYAALRDRYPG